MAKLTMVFGVLLGALGVAAYEMTGGVHRSTLLPAVVGVVLILSGLLANTANRSKRMLWMHVAVTFGTLGFLGSAALVVMQYMWAQDGTFADSAMAEEWGAMCVLCLIFVVLCVRSFIAARRERAAAR